MVDRLFSVLLNLVEECFCLYVDAPVHTTGLAPITVHLRLRGFSSKDCLLQSSAIVVSLRRLISFNAFKAELTGVECCKSVHFTQITDRGLTLVCSYRNHTVKQAFSFYSYCSWFLCRCKLWALHLEIIYSFIHSFIPQSLLRQVHSLFQRHFSTLCDLVFSTLISNVSSFP